MPDIELIGQVLAYAGAGLVVLVVAFYAVDALTPGSLGVLVIEDHNPNAALLTAATLVSTGLVMWFAIFFTGSGWDGLLDVLVFGLVAVVAQVAGFKVLDLLTPGALGDVCMRGGPEGRTLAPSTWVSAAVMVAMALPVCAALT